MNAPRTRQSGFHLILIVIVLVVIGIIAALGFVWFKNRDASNGSGSSASTSTDTKSVQWMFDEKALRWVVQSGKAPQCKDPFVFDQTPIDISQATSLLMPGSYRGFSYKPHGGFRLDTSVDGAVEVKMPVDATLVALTRYYEGTPPTLQYLLTFETDCGIAFRFDHLYTLSPAFQAIAETTPEPKIDDTRTDPNLPFTRTKFKAGDTIATKIGFPATRNFGFDFGVYDYRERNEISKNATWAAIHTMYPSTEWYARCWFNLLPEADAAKAKELGKVVVNPNKPNIVSDLCTDAPYTTLDFNGGQPTDG
jgi:hypothetical protein